MWDFSGIVRGKKRSTWSQPLIYQITLANRSVSPRASWVRIRGVTPAFAADPNNGERLARRWCSPSLLGAGTLQIWDPERPADLHSPHLKVPPVLGLRSPSCRQVNGLLDGLDGERLPTIDLTHADLAGGEQRIHMVKPIPMKESGPSPLRACRAAYERPCHWGRNYAYWEPNKRQTTIRAYSTLIRRGWKRSLGSVPAAFASGGCS